MKKKEMSSFKIVAVFMFIVVDVSQAEKCSGSSIGEVVEFTPKKIFSPGYPHNYEQGDTCEWRLSPITTDPNYAMQIVVLEIDIKENSQPCEDGYLDIFEGTKMNRGKQLAKLCGQEKVVIKSTSNMVTIHFVAHSFKTGKGFIIESTLVKYAPVECLEDKVAVVSIGTRPVVEEFISNPNLKRCEWKIESASDEYLVLELFSKSTRNCSYGKYTIYDGDVIDTKKSFDWCSNEKPFSEFFLSSSSATLVSEHDGETSDSITLKIYTRPTVVDSCEFNSLRSIQVVDAPVIFSVPFTKTFQDKECEIRLWNDDGSYLRLDVMSSSNSESSCVSDAVLVASGRDDLVLVKGCNRRMNPVYHQEGADLIVKSSSINTVGYVRVAPTGFECNSFPSKQTAYSSYVTEKMFPSHRDTYQNLEKCQVLITAESEDQIVSLTLSWQRPYQFHQNFVDDDVCEGDFVSIYDGEREELLFTTCRLNNKPDNIIHGQVLSSGQSLLVIFDADKQAQGASIKLQYFSIQGKDVCKDSQLITVEERAKTLTSPNYPNNYPLKHQCLYHLKMDQPDMEMVIKVIEADLGKHCQDLIEVIRGTWSPVEPQTDVIGQICGHSSGKEVLISNSNDATLYFISDENTTGKWKLEIFLVPKGTYRGSANIICMNLLLISMSILLIIFQKS